MIAFREESKATFIYSGGVFSMFGLPVKI